MFAQCKCSGRHLKCFLANKNFQSLQIKQTGMVNKISICCPKSWLSGTKLCVVHRHSCPLSLLLTMKSVLWELLPQSFAFPVSQTTKYMMHYRYCHGLSILLHLQKMLQELRSHSFYNSSLSSDM